MTLPDRRSIRLKNYDYSTPGTYFITVCSNTRKCIFGDVRDDSIKLNPVGVMVQECWLEIPRHFPFIHLDEFIVMPNHIHGIIVIRELSR